MSSARYVQPLRTIVQSIFLLMSVYVGITFLQFVHHIETGGVSPYVPRPESIEAFLPISGLLGLSAWFRGLGINNIHPAATVIFFTVLVQVFVLRRCFCSWICPVGTISELFWKSGFAMLKRSFRLPLLPDRLLRSLKYMLLAVFMYSIPFSMSSNALEAFILSDYHKVADIRLLDFFRNPSNVSVSVILFFVIVSLFVRNPFCRFLCPYGALAGLIALFSPAAVTRDSEKCVSCGACTQVCPSRIDVKKAGRVYDAECIGCWRCISFCRFNQALSMRFLFRFAMPGVLFAVLVVATFFIGRHIGEISGKWSSAISREEYFRIIQKQR